MPAKKLRKIRGFDDRFVAFVDVLGFRDIVEQMDARPELFESVRDTLKTVDAHGARLRESARARRRAKEKGTCVGTRVVRTEHRPAHK